MGDAYGYRSDTAEYAARYSSLPYLRQTRSSDAAIGLPANGWPNMLRHANNDQYSFVMATYFHCGIFQKPNSLGQIEYSSGIVTMSGRVDTSDEYERLRKALADKAGCDPEKFILTALSLL